MVIIALINSFISNELNIIAFFDLPFTHSVEPLGPTCQFQLIAAIKNLYYPDEGAING
jgi:hypothetical protein